MIIKKILAVILNLLLLSLLVSFTFVPYNIESVELKEKQNSNDNLLKIHSFPLNSKGDGDCFIITFNDIQILVDAGTEINSMQAIKTQIEKLENLDSLWDYVIVTHADSDHIASFNNNYDNGLFNYFQSKKIIIDTFIDFDFSNDHTIDFSTSDYTHQQVVDNYFSSQVYKNYVRGRDNAISKGFINKYFTASQCCWRKREELGFISSEQKKDKSYIAAKDKGATDTFKLDENNDITLKILYNYFYDHRIGTNVQPTSGEKNVLSTSFIIEYGNHKMLFTGDMVEYDSQKDYRPIFGESYLIKYNPDDLKNITLYKAAHHGRRTSSSKKFIDYIQPEYVLIPCVAGNSISASSILMERSPSQSVLNNLMKFTDNIYIPSLAVLDSNNQSIGFENYYGEILFVSNGTKFETFTENNIVKNSNEYPGFGYPMSIFDTKWFIKNRKSRLNVFHFDGFISPKEAYFGNCTLIKYGDYDILIDCGVIKSNYKDSKALIQTNFIKKLKEEYITDNIIELVIVTTPSASSYQQMIDLVDSSNNVIMQGVLNSFTIKNIVDYGDVPNPCTPSKYNERSKFLSYNATLEKLIKNGTNYIDGTVYAGKKLDIDLPRGLDIEILNNPGYRTNTNNSLCFIVSYFGKRMLFTGRIYDTIEDDIAKLNDISNITYYQAANFGDLYSNTIPILDEICSSSDKIRGSNNDREPYIIVNSIPNKEFYDNPILHRDLVERLNSYSSKTYLTIDYNENGYIDLFGDLNFFLTYNNDSIEYGIDCVKQPVNIIGTNYYKTISHKN